MSRSLRGWIHLSVSPRTCPAVLAALLLAAAPALAEAPAHRVKDIKTSSPTVDIPWPWGGESVAWRGGIYFGTGDGIHGNELWRWTPGTAPEMLADICPGECGAWPREFTPLGNHVYFSAEDADHGRELWRSDGTRDGTRLVADLSPGLGGSSPDFLVAADDGRLYFSAGREAREGRELWTSDGSIGGTYEVADILPGPEGSNPTSIVVHGGALYFTADDGLSGRELWTSDGTAGGTRLVEDLCPGPADCLWEEQRYLYDPRVLHSAAKGLMIVTGPAAALDGLALLPDGASSIESLAVDPHAFGGFQSLGEAETFGACDPFPECGIWRSDGTAAGTYSLYVVPQGPTNDFVSTVGVANGWAYFTVRIDDIFELWRTDGALGAAELVRALDSVPGYWQSAPRGAAVGRRLFFASATRVAGMEPWVTDGTAAGTFQLADVYPGERGSLSPFVPQRFAVAAGQVTFFAMHPDDDWALWSTDLTTEGTGLVADIDQQVSGIPTALLFGSNLRAGQLDGRLLFGADAEATGIEPWITDGTGEGTELLADLAPGTSDSGYPSSSYPVDFLADRGLAVIASYNGLWASDGTSEGTVELQSDGDASKLFTMPSITPLGTTEIFATGSTLTVTDGTPGGTISLESDVDYGNSLVSEGVIFLGKCLPPTGCELWITTGEPYAATLLRDVYPGADSSYPELLGTLSGRVLFGADDGIHGRELWSSDGTEPGTTLLIDIDPNAAGDPRLGGPDHAPAILGGLLYFTADDGISGRELWASDGTAEGTFRVADINRGAAPSDPSEMVVAGERLFFFANDGIRGRELWVVDSAGKPPRLVRDINPGSASATPIQRMGRRILAVGDRVYFAAHDGRSGAELWTSDGTAHGTQRHQDINPGPGSSSPSNFVIAGTCLYFSANDGGTGFELWALPLGERPSVSDRSCAPARQLAAEVDLRALPLPR